MVDHAASSFVVGLQREALANEYILVDIPQRNPMSAASNGAAKHLQSVFISHVNHATEVRFGGSILAPLEDHASTTGQVHMRILLNSSEFGTHHNLPRSCVAPPGKRRSWSGWRGPSPA